MNMSSSAYARTVHVVIIIIIIERRADLVTGGRMCTAASRGPNELK